VITIRRRAVELQALAIPEVVAFRLLEAAALRRVFAPRRDTLESAALHRVERAALNVLDWVARRSAG